MQSIAVGIEHSNYIFLPLWFFSSDYIYLIMFLVLKNLYEQMNSEIIGKGKTILE